jgi:hypothetical protein
MAKKKDDQETVVEEKPVENPTEKPVNVSEFAEPSVTLPPPAPNAEEIRQESIADIPGQGQFFPDSEAFNPEIHAADDAGNPVRKSDGTFAKKRGRKKGSTNTPQVMLSEDERMNGAKLSATIVVQTLLTFGQMLGGDEWTPKLDPVSGLDESQSLVQAYTTWFYASGFTQVPPWLGAVVVTMAFVTPRLAMPKTQARIRQLIAKFRGGVKIGLEKTKPITGVAI